MTGVRPPAPNEIGVFHLSDPGEWVAHRDEILKRIVAASGLPIPSWVKADYEYSIDALTGSIRYAMLTDLWSPSPKRGLPPGPEPAGATAEGFLQRLTALCRAPDYRELQIPPLLPSGAARTRHLDTTEVRHFEHGWVDHWLVRFGVHVQPFAGRGDSVPAFGAVIEVRVGQLGRVVGYSSSWRPTYLRPVTPSATAVGLSDSDLAGMKDEEGNAVRAEQSVLAYVLDGENSPQNFLCPYHVVVTDDVGAFFPASSHSITPHFHHVDNPDGSVTVYGIVEGGSGDNLFSWSAYRVDEAWDTDVQYLGHGREATFRRRDGSQSTYSSVDLAPGSYVVILNAMDADTGVIKHAQQSIYTQPDTAATHVTEASSAATLG